MSTTIRKMTFADKTDVIEMMMVFYASDAVLTNGSEKIFSDDIDTCAGESPYLEGYIFEDAENIQGYAMVAKSFSTECGKPCIWIEDLYIKDEYRGMGIGNLFMEFIAKKYQDSILRLEVDKENKRAIGLYEKNGFTILPYIGMKK